eukprot:534324_1
MVQRLSEEFVDLVEEEVEAEVVAVLRGVARPEEEEGRVARPEEEEGRVARPEEEEVVVDAGVGADRTYFLYSLQNKIWKDLDSNKMSKFVIKKKKKKKR